MGLGLRQTWLRIQAPKFEFCGQVTSALQALAPISKMRSMLSVCQGCWGAHSETGVLGILWHVIGSSERQKLSCLLLSKSRFLAPALHHHDSLLVSHVTSSCWPQTPSSSLLWTNSSSSQTNLQGQSSEHFPSHLSSAYLSSLILEAVLVMMPSPSVTYHLCLLRQVWSSSCGIGMMSFL